MTSCIAAGHHQLLSHSVRVAEERRPMPVRITDESRDAWKMFAREHGVTVTSLIETLGIALTDVTRLPGVISEAIEAARVLDGERRGR